jgi:hypothetical protein
MHFNIDLARKSIRADGCLIEILVANSNGRLEKTRRVNPSFRVQADALKALKGLSRRMELLEEELDAAATKQKKEEEVSEFSI